VIQIEIAPAISFVLPLRGGVQPGEIYKSINMNGGVVYSDRRVPSTSHSTVVQLEGPRFPPQQLLYIGSRK
jgi:hypothetical protein